MRLIVTILILLVLAGWLASRVEFSPPSAQGAVESGTWVRTVDGWERRSDWATSRPLYDPALHPLVIAALELLVSLAALIAVTDNAKQRHLASQRHRDSADRMAAR